MNNNNLLDLEETKKTSNYQYIHQMEHQIDHQSTNGPSDNLRKKNNKNINRKLITSNNEGQNEDNRQDRQPSMLDFKRENSNSFFGSRYLDLSREGSRNNSFFFNFDGELNKFNSKPNM